MSFLIVGVDGSASAQAALRAAVEQATHLNCKVKAINVVTLPVMSGYEYGPLDIESMQDAARNTLADALAALRTEFNNDLPVELETDVPTGHVGIELLRAAEEDGGAAMVVVGSRGYGGFKSLLLGSVTTYLAHHLTCPLLIIPGVDG